MRPDPVSVPPIALDNDCKVLVAPVHSIEELEVIENFMLSQCNIIPGELDQRLHELSDSMLFSIARTVARFACEVCEVSDHPIVKAALNQIESASSTERVFLRVELEQLAKNFDDEYFRISEEGACRNEADLLFRQSRALASLAFAIEPARRGAVSHAIYEAASAMPKGCIAEVGNLIKRTIDLLK